MHLKVYSFIYCNIYLFIFDFGWCEALIDLKSLSTSEGQQKKEFLDTNKELGANEIWACGLLLEIILILTNIIDVETYCFLCIITPLHSQNLQ